MNTLSGTEMLKIFLARETQRQASNLFASDEQIVSLTHDDFAYQMRKITDDHINFGFLSIGQTMRFIIIGYINSNLEFTVMPKFEEEFEDLSQYDINVNVKEMGLHEKLLITAFSYEAHSVAAKGRDAKIGLFGQPLEFFRAHDGDVNVYFFDHQIGCYYVATGNGIGFNDEQHALAMELGNKKLFSCITPI